MKRFRKVQEDERKELLEKQKSLNIAPNIKRIPIDPSKRIKIDKSSETSSIFGDIKF